jgi:NACalpha-BTF3-like transcription factor
VSDFVEEKSSLDEKKSADALKTFQTAQSQAADAATLMALSPSDVKSIMDQLEVTKAEAEQSLRSNEGDLQRALRSLIRSA